LARELRPATEASAEVAAHRLATSATLALWCSLRSGGGPV